MAAPKEPAFSNNPVPPGEVPKPGEKVFTFDIPPRTTGSHLQQAARFGTQGAGATKHVQTGFTDGVLNSNLLKNPKDMSFRNPRVVDRPSSGGRGRGGIGTKTTVESTDGGHVDPTRSGSGQQGGIGQTLPEVVGGSPRTVGINEWKTRLLEASWRGVKFEVEQWTIPVGRRTFMHEYPQRDDVFVEDSGKVIRTHQITAFVLGDDYDIHRNLLIRALEREGAGELVHPYLGKRKCKVGDGCRVTELVAEQRISKFELSFVEVGDESALLILTDNVTQASNASAAAVSSASSAYAAKDALLTDFALAETVLKGYLDFKDSMGRGLALLFGVGLDLASSLTDIDALGPYLVAQHELWRLITAATHVPTIPPNLRFDEDDGARTLSTWVKTEILGRCVDLVLATPYTNRDDAVFDAQSTMAAIRVAEAETQDPEVYDRLAGLRITFAQAVLDLGRFLPRLRDLELATVIPAHVLSYSLYDTPYRDTEIVNRNAVENPNFVSGHLRVLSR